MEKISFVQTRTALRGYVKSYGASISYNCLEALINDLAEPIYSLLVRINKNIKFVVVVKIRFVKGDEQHTEVLDAYFQTKPIVYFKRGKLPDIRLEKVKELVAVFTSQVSGWTINEITNVYVNIVNYKPLKGSSYVDLPPAIKNKKAIINVKNKGNDCCRVAIRSAIHLPTSTSNRLSSYPSAADDGLNFDGIAEPTPITDIPKIEEHNDLTINVYTLEDDEITPCYISEYRGSKTINLFLHQDHYCWIKTLDRLLNTKTSHGYHCERCLIWFFDKPKLADHIDDCRGINTSAVRVEMPKQTHVKFENYQKQLPVPYVIYADFETFNVPCDPSDPDVVKGKTTKVFKEVTNSFCYIVVRCDGHVEEPVLYRGSNAGEEFLRMLQAEEQKIKNLLQHPRKMIYNSLVDEKFQAETICHICQKPFEKKSVEGDKETDKLPKKDKVRDHCHITGRYRGAAHRKCNLNFRFNSVIPVISHNMRGFDAHLIMQHIEKFGGDISCIPNNMEKYISFELGSLRFLDSCQFLLLPLEKLAKSVDKKDYILTKKFGGPNWELLTQKGAYPYQWMDSWEKLGETQLPPKEQFHSLLKGCGIEELSEEDRAKGKKDDYEKAQIVWNIFNCKNMGDYHDLYLKTDVLLLADIFEKFRKTMQHHYSLDPAHYYTSSNYAMDAMLKSTGVKLALLQDIEMHLFIEKGMRGGISTESKRYVKANNKYHEDYDSSKPSTYIQYLDANNLYGWAMVQALPYGGFAWEDSIELADVLCLSPDSPTGYILEVDLEYPEELHDAHNSYPLAPEHITLKHEQLSPYKKKLVKTLQPIPKLVPNLYDKKKYVIHYRNLQLYTQLGMRVTKLHRVLRFDQSKWLQSYIKKNTDYRTEAKSDFEKNLYKLLNNSVYGKTMENIRKRITVNFVRDQDKAKKLTCKPTYKDHRIFGENLVAISMKKSKIVLDKPIYAGFCILELSKWLMYDFYYNNLKKQYGDRCELLYTDTDSLLLEIQTDDVYEDMQQHHEYYDTSEYPSNHFLHSLTNKKVLGKMKDEYNGKPVIEYVGLRSKMYSILAARAEGKKEEDCKKVAKGVSKAIIKHTLKHENYKDALFTNVPSQHEMYMFRSDHHNVNLVKINKTSLSPFDGKRYILNNGIDTLAFGHIRSMTPQ